MLCNDFQTYELEILSPKESLLSNSSSGTTQTRAFDAASTDSNISTNIFDEADPEQEAQEEEPAPEFTKSDELKSDRLENFKFLEENLTYSHPNSVTSEKSFKKSTESVTLIEKELCVTLPDIPEVFEDVTPKKKVRGIGLKDFVRTVIIDNLGPNPGDDRILTQVSGIEYPPVIEPHESIQLSESRIIVEDILNELIFNFPTISLVALNKKPKPRPEPKWKNFTPDEVVVHNSPDDCWVTILGSVYNITKLIKLHWGEKCIRPLLAFAGKDISHWFNENGCFRQHIDSETGEQEQYLPHGPVPDVDVPILCPSWKSWYCVKPADPFVPWWKDVKYKIGNLTKCARPVRIINMHTYDECVLIVCQEDKLSRILERLTPFNSHAANYTWKYESRVLDMDKTLDENLIYDERETFLKHFLPDDTYTPAICLYFNDDFIRDQDTDED